MTIGELGMLLVIVGAIPYMWHICRGNVRPERVSWFVWTVVLLLAVWGYRSSGATDSIWFLVGDLLVTGLTFLLSLWRGRGGWTKLDVACLTIALCSLALWQFSGVELFILWGAMMADMAAAVPTIVKSLQDPRSENVTAYMCASAGALCGFMAVGKWSLGLLLYPAYLFLVNLVIGLVVWVGQYQLRRMQL